MNQKKRAPTLTFKAIGAGAPVGALEVVREPVDEQPEALEWALDVELEAFREALPHAFAEGAPDSVERANGGLYEEAASISSALLAQVAATQNAPRERGSSSLPELPSLSSLSSLPSFLSEDALPGRYEMSADAFDVDERVSRLIEARGTAAAPSHGRSETSSFPDLNAYESYDASSDAPFVTEGAGHHQAGRPAPLEAFDPVVGDRVDYTPPSFVPEAHVVMPPSEGSSSGVLPHAVSGRYEAVSGSYHIVSVPPRPKESPEDLLSGDASVQLLPSQSERRARYTQSQTALIQPKSPASRGWVWISCATALSLVAAGVWFFGLI